MRKLPETLNLDQFQQILNQVPKRKKKIKLAFLLGFYQCLRVSEVISLKKENVDINRGFLHVIAGKGNKDRDIPIMQPVQFHLRYLPINLTRQALHKAIKRYSKLALNHSRIHFHSLRHSGASFYLNNKDRNIRSIQELLGHARLSTTEIYLSITPQQLKKDFETIW